eukprot:CAMPEP_0184514378 /NCGR_PEP_ID=MMETSP0198_2-20121128/3932_1 /TAXON_ID=1112570 /ORGANISM="Thraustochytrium sp., Strain LLF1b" /LENGTH=142 /DNA_ID=CAMNT_0026904565 /DNA_START=261 /DNA_END=689 /DNA_ORIENTATION=-
MKAMSDKYYVPLATIPAHYVLAMLPGVLSSAVKASEVGPARFDNDTPRKDAGEHCKLYYRLKGMHYNALEMFPALVAGILMAKVQKVSPSELHRLAVQHLKLRLVYMFLYVAGVHPLIQAGRSVAWTLLIKNLLSMYGASLA